MQPSESVTYNHVICVGLVRETEVNGEKVEEIVTGDDVPMDIKRVRLTVSSGPETSGDSSTPVSITRQKLGPSWSVLDPASGVSDAKLINGTYPTWYGQPKKIDNAKYKAQFHQKAKMLTFDEACAFTGHAPGGVCSFALPENVKTYLDVSLKRFETVFPAAGSSNSAIEMTCEELERYSSNFSGWVDVCKPKEG